MVHIRVDASPYQDLHTTLLVSVRRPTSRGHQEFIDIQQEGKGRKTCQNVGFSRQEY